MLPFLSFCCCGNSLIIVSSQLMAKRGPGLGCSPWPPGSSRQGPAPLRQRSVGRLCGNVRVGVERSPRERPPWRRQCFRRAAAVALQSLAGTDCPAAYSCRCHRCGCSDRHLPRLSEAVRHSAGPVSGLESCSARNKRRCLLARRSASGHRRDKCEPDTWED